MDLPRIILGPVVTEKMERMKEQRTYAMRVHAHATKIDVKQALKRFYGVDVTSVRVLRVRSKTRSLGAGKVLTKRNRSKRVMVTLAPKSKVLDLAQFKSA
jgi:ribosomal protein L23